MKFAKILALIFVAISTIVAMPVLAVNEPIFELKSSATQIALDESVTLTFIIRANSIGKLRFPTETADFVVVAQSNSTSIRIVNGERSQQHRITLMLDPKHLGTFLIPAASIDAQGSTYTSEPFSVTVVQATNNQQNLPRANQSTSQTNRVTPNLAQQQPAQTQSPSQSYKVFAKWIPSNTSPYVGEQIRLKLRIYHQGNLKRIDFTKASFSFDNFLLADKPDKGYEGEEIIDGQKYLFYEFAATLFPLKAGRAVIPAEQLNLTLVDVDAMRARAFDPFAQLVTRSFDKQETISTNSLAIDVRALPNPAPKGFSGYVGTLSLSHQLDKTQVEEGAAVMLTTTASGSGNHKNLSLDCLAKSNQYSSFSDKQNTTQSINAGVRSFRISSRKAIIPKRSGKLLVETNPFVYFNTNSRRYETIAAQKFELDVSPGNGSEAKLPDDFKEDVAPVQAELLVASPQKILSHRNLELVPLWLMYLILALLNFVYLIFSLRGHFSRLPEINLSPALIKQIRSASSIEEITVLMKDFARRIAQPSSGEQFMQAGVTANQSAQVVARLDQFFAKTDRLLYSGKSTDEESLSEVRAEALSIYEELKHHAK